ncbi:hypothetical protein COO58_16870 [Micromonospora sp. WMMA1996]|nr:hypothetical protein COO58_16870 [Micromonospora sp. WMMA1996]
MNPLIRGLFNKFRESEELATLADSDAFELFAAKLALGDDLLSQVSLTDLLLDSGNIGVDICAIEINGQLVWDVDDVRDVCNATKKIEVVAHFIQAKQSASISSGDILSFGDTVRRFLANHQDLESYPRFQDLARAMGLIFADYATSLKGPPSVVLTMATTAPRASTRDPIVVNRAETARSHIQDLGYIDKVDVKIWGADDLHEAWVRKNHANEVEIQLEKQVNLPRMPGVDQAILGVVSVAELLKLIRAEDGTLDERVFYDNVRGFKGADNRVNRQIMDTLASDERSLLPVLNNGVTVVASTYSPKPGDTVAVSGYQIVNGCQTSHCLYLSLGELGEHLESVFVPLRLVVTADDDIATRIIRATNSQTEVGENDLVALTKFQKRLEDFYRLDTHDVKLIYERRSGQFFDKDVTKTRIVTISDQMRAVSALFLDNPHTAARYTGMLYDEVGDSIFREDHKLLPYLVSAFAAYRLENAFRTGLDPSLKPARYHILTARKYLILGKRASPLNAKSAEAESERILESLKAPDQVAAFQSAADEVMRTAGGAIPSRDRLKRQQFTQDLIANILSMDVQA